jgi:NAD(P)-dependent dehydrogenase (short-subunit alcohol dehydrogenase family)
VDLELRDRVVVVTGGSAGIGRAATELFLHEGARVAICARDPARLETVARELSARFAGRVLAFPCDVLQQDQVERFRDEVLARFGQVDALINNAGRGHLGTFTSADDAVWQEELQLKFFSVIRPTRAFIEPLRASQSGALVVVSSLLARQPEAHMVVTSAARAGVQNLVKSLSVELAPVRVNSILLGVVDSEQWRRRYATQAKPGQTLQAWYSELARERKIPLARFGEAREAATAIAYLASPAASYITGAALEVSGGASRSV